MVVNCLCDTELELLDASLQFVRNLSGLSVPSLANAEAFDRAVTEVAESACRLISSGVLDVIPRMLARFHAERPEVRIVLHNLTKAKQIDALRERRISVGFNRLVPPEDDLVVGAVLRERLMVALPEAHPLARQAALTSPC